jgi:uncharacterized membrane protein YecN with MAPEG domain
MHSPSAITLLAFIAWALALLVVMEAIRSYLVLSGKVPANGFDPSNSTLSPFMQRLARAHANCLEGLPIFGGLLALALLTDQTAITDPLAYALLAARLLQSGLHLYAISPRAVTLRFGAFSVQMLIAVYWVFGFISAVAAR